MQTLSDDFVIRANQTGYARETTVITVTNNGKAQDYTLHTGEKIVFTLDSNVQVRK